jgi:hypothetical protein
MPRRCGLVMQQLGSLPKTIPLRHYQQCVRFAIWADSRDGNVGEGRSPSRRLFHAAVENPSAISAR